MGIYSFTSSILFLYRIIFLIILPGLLMVMNCSNSSSANSIDIEYDGSIYRERISINEGWKFMRYTTEPDKLIYDERPKVASRNDNVVADTRPSDSVLSASSEKALKKWILPSANDFIKDPAKHYQRPDGNPGSDFPFVQSNFNDNAWEQISLPHDWAIKGPFYTEANAIVGGGMGRLPIHGVAWYRKKLNILSSDAGKSIYLDIDGAMSYAMVWFNGNLVGGWPYGYNSFRLDLTPYIKAGDDNQLAIRLDNPPNSSRWYPGGGIYRNVWLTKVNPVHVAQWGTFISSRDVSASSATVNLAVHIENKSGIDQSIEVVTEVYALDDKFNRIEKKLATFPNSVSTVQASRKLKVENSVTIKNPLLWGPLPAQKPNLYVAVTRLYVNGKPVDEYETRFGIRSLKFDPVKGLLVNDKAIRFQGVNQHHDGKDLSFITLKVVDSKGIIVPEAANKIKFRINGPGEIVATDNGDPGDLVSFDSKERSAFSGLALVIIRSKTKMPGTIKITAESNGLPPAQIAIKGQ